MSMDASGRSPAIAEEDRLPWLESADDSYSEGPSASRLILLAVLALAVVGALVWAFGHFGNRGGVAGTGELITAQDGDYKVKPEEPGGMKVDGQGDTVFRTSEGASASGTIDTRAVPETLVAGKTAAPAPRSAPGTTNVVTAVPSTSGRLTAQAPAVTITRATAGGGGGSLVQLGSFPTEGAANAAWETVSKRFAYVASLGKSVEKAEVNGSTVYRLRVNAGSNGNANTICGRLKVAGEACFVPN